MGRQAEERGNGMTVMVMMIAQQIEAKGGKTVVFDVGQLATKTLLGVDAVKAEMRRRKVRFLPSQVVRRIQENLSINPFQS